MIPSSPDVFSPALRALIAAAGDDDDALAEALRHAAATPGPPLPHVAAVHGLTPLLTQRLRQANLQGLLPPDQWEALKTRYVRGARRQQVLLELAAAAGHALRRAGLPCLALKGLALTALLGDEQMPREMVDLDLLIPPAAMPPALDALRAAGWKQVPYPWAPTPWEYHLPQLDQREMRLEPHWRLWPRGPLQPFALPDAAALLARGHPDETLGVLVPDLPTQLLITAAGMAVDGFATYLRHWAELHWLWQRMDEAAWAALWQQADEWRMAGYLRLTLTRVQALWPRAQLPPELQGPPQPADQRLRPLTWRRLNEAPVRRASFWMLLTLRRLRRPDLSDPHWREQLPPHVRAAALQEAARGAMAQTGGAFVAGSRLARRTALWLLSGAERQALREEMLVSEMLYELAE